MSVVYLGLNVGIFSTPVKGSPMDRIDAMQLFIRVADAGSFSKAAADAGVGQPTVSRRIQELENQLNADLFQRRQKSLCLTEAGERFYSRCISILTEYEEAEKEARGLQHDAIGLLRIVSPHSFARRVIAPLLADFMAQNPQLNIDLISESSVSDLVGGRIDIGIWIGDLSQSKRPHLKLAETANSLWASPRHLEKFGTPTHPDDLRTHRAVMYKNLRGDPIHLTNDVTGETASINPEGPMIASSVDILSRASADGLGYILAPYWSAGEYVEDGRLVRILPEWEAKPLHVNCVWASKQMRGNAKLFIEYLTKNLNLDTCKTASRSVRV